MEVFIKWLWGPLTILLSWVWWTTSNYKKDLTGKIDHLERGLEQKANKMEVASKTDVEYIKQMLNKHIDGEHKLATTKDIDHIKELMQVKFAIIEKLWKDSVKKEGGINGS